MLCNHCGTSLGEGSSTLCGNCAAEQAAKKQQHLDLLQQARIAHDANLQVQYVIVLGVAALLLVGLIATSYFVLTKNDSKLDSEQQVAVITADKTYSDQFAEIANAIEESGHKINQKGEPQQLPRVNTAAHNKNSNQNPTVHVAVENLPFPSQYKSISPKERARMEVPSPVLRLDWDKFSDKQSEIEVFVDGGNETVMFAFIPEGMSDFDLLGPDGKSVISKDTATAPYGFPQITLKNPLPGTYLMVLTTKEPERLSLHGAVTFSNTYGVLLGRPAGEMKPNDKATITARVADLGDPEKLVAVDGGTAVAIIDLPDQETKHSLELHDDGEDGDTTSDDGIFSAIFAHADTGGRYEVNVEAKIEIAGNMIHRSVTDSFEVSAASDARFKNQTFKGVDLNEDGKFDLIEVEIEIEKSIRSDLRVDAQVIDQKGNQVTLVGARLESYPGDIVKTVIEIETSPLVEHGENGPWALKELRIFDLNRTLELDKIERIDFPKWSLKDFDDPRSPKAEYSLPSRGTRFGGDRIVVHGDRLEHIKAARLGGVPVTNIETWNQKSFAFVTPRQKEGIGEEVDLEIETPWQTVTFPKIFTYQDIPPRFIIEGEEKGYGVRLKEGDERTIMIKLSAQPDAEMRSRLFIREQDETKGVKIKGSNEITLSPENWERGVPIVLHAARDTNKEDESVYIEIEALNYKSGRSLGNESFPIEVKDKESPPDRW